MFKTAYNVVKTLGAAFKNAVIEAVIEVKTFFTQPAIEGEYLGKGGIDLSRRAFFRKSAFATVATTCLVMLPAISFAAVPTEVTTAITDAATDVATVGAAVLVVIVGIYAFKWIRRAF